MARGTDSSHVQVDAQARDAGAFGGVCGSRGQRRQALLRLRQRAGEELAFGPIQLQREDKFVPAFPTIFGQQSSYRR